MVVIEWCKCSCGGKVELIPGTGHSCILLRCKICNKGNRFKMIAELKLPDIVIDSET